MVPRGKRQDFWGKICGLLGDSLLATRELRSTDTVERMASEAWNGHPASPELQNVPVPFKNKKPNYKLVATPLTRMTAK